jgi:uncharacterized protein (DUF305 family)
MTSRVESDRAVESDEPEPVSTDSRVLRVVLIAIASVAVLVAAVVVAYNAAPDGSSASSPSVNSVDAGFARDMSTHHLQAVEMAGYTRDNTDNPAIKVLAYDIESSQNFQVGEMQGWLDTWGLSRTGPKEMSWMIGHSLEPDGLMPGMAKPAQMSTLLASHGKALNILFLQLMIHHHQGGVVMAQYAADHAETSYVRDLAQAMYSNQSNEIVQMEQLLRQLGGTPLPPPAD